MYWLFPLTLCMNRYSVKANASIANRMVSSARGVLNKYIPDVYISTDVIQRAKRYVKYLGEKVVE